MGNTPKGITYPEPTDLVTDGAAAMQELATDVDVLLDSFATDAEQAAAVATLNAAISGRARVAIGTYTGDGAAARTIAVAFDPAVVLLTGPAGYHISRLAGGGFGVRVVTSGAAAVGSDEFLAPQPVAGGFAVGTVGGAGAQDTNILNGLYRFVAIG